MITRCNLLLQSIRDAVLLLDLDGNIQFTNPATASITGFPSGNLLQKHLSHFYSSDIIKAEYELSQAKKIGYFVSQGWRTRNDGSQFWGELSLSLVYDGDNAVGYSCILRDLTQKKQEELELKRSEERYRLMVEGVKEYAIFMLDPKGNIVTWNEGAKKLKGYSADEIVGKHFSIFYTAEDLEKEKPKNELEIAIATGKYEEVGWRVKKNGSVFWANVVITALFNEQNKLIGFSKVTRDLTERRESEETLRQSEERYRLLVQQVKDYGIFMLDEKGRIISWNEGAKKLKGYEAEEIIGKYFSIFYPEEDILSDKPNHELKIAREEGKYEEEGWRLRKDGSRFWANVVITAVYNSDGTLIGYSKVTRDLTERKETEHALQQVSDRFRLLANELKVANDELTYANAELGQFTSIVSHDLQEPIRTIKSFLQLVELKLKEGELENVHQYINKSINAANRMRELIQNLLHYSQLSKADVEMNQVDVNKVITEALQNLKTAIDTSKAQLTIESDIEYVYGDRVQLLQLIQNLLSNALKFADKANPRVHIRCVREKDGTVKFSVSDNGIGIASCDIDKVFEIFRRLSTARDYPGTGIGLAICKKIVERHGGKIWPESQPGKGTTFYFTLNQQLKKGKMA